MANCKEEFLVGLHKIELEVSKILGDDVRTDFPIYRVRMLVNPMFWDRPRGELH